MADDDFDGRPLTAKQMGVIVNLDAPTDMASVRALAGEDERMTLGMIERGVAGSSAMKETDDKPKFHLIDPHFELGLAEVLTSGADKYSDENWREGRLFTDYISAARRHLNAIERGEDIDRESGQQHSYHLGCCAMFLSEFIRQKEKYAKFDNRHKDPVSDRLLRGIAKDN